MNWKNKLTSRKLWAAIVGFVTPMLIAFGVTESTTAEVTAIIMAGASLIAYIVGEGLVDAARAGTATEQAATEQSNTRAIGFTAESGNKED